MTLVAVCLIEQSLSMVIVMRNVLGHGRIVTARMRRHHWKFSRRIPAAVRRQSMRTGGRRAQRQCNSSKK